MRVGKIKKHEEWTDCKRKTSVWLKIKFPLFSFKIIYKYRFCLEKLHSIDKTERREVFLGGFISQIILKIIIIWDNVLLRAYVHDRLNC